MLFKIIISADLTGEDILKLKHVYTLGLAESSQFYFIRPIAKKCCS